MNKDWHTKIGAAQKKRTITIEKKKHERVAYGNEEADFGANEHPCGDCGVVKGQLHVPICCKERCPACKGQALMCSYFGCNSQ